MGNIYTDYIGKDKGTATCYANAIECNFTQIKIFFTAHGLEVKMLCLISVFHPSVRKIITFHFWNHQGASACDLWPCIHDNDYLKLKNIHEKWKCSCICVYPWVPEGTTEVLPVEIMWPVMWQLTAGWLSEKHLLCEKAGKTFFCSLLSEEPLIKQKVAELRRLPTLPTLHLNTSWVRTSAMSKLLTTTPHASQWLSRNHPVQTRYKLMLAISRINKPMNQVMKVLVYFVVSNTPTDTQINNKKINKKIEISISANSLINTNC